MKRLFAVFGIIVLALSFCACAKTKVNTTADVTLTFVYGEENISVSLDGEEAEKVIAILDGNSYDPVFSGVPSCGFDADISLKVGDRTFAIARDTCNILQDLGNHRYLSVSQEEIDYLHSLFEKYGGHFPCI